MLWVRTVIGLLALSLVARAHAAPGDCTATCFVDAVAGSDTLNQGTSSSDAFATLQKALDTVASAGTVIVAPGLYSPNFTIVAKSVTLLGAQAGVDPLTRTPPSAAVESIVESNIGFSITGVSAQVTIDGFVFRNKVPDHSSGTGISTGSGLDDVGASVTIVRNIFDDVHIGISSVLARNTSSFSISHNVWLGGDTGMQLLGDGGAATVSVDANRFDSITNSAVRVWVFAGATVTDNVVASHGGPQDAISVGGCVGCTIAGNVLTASGAFDVISLGFVNRASANCAIEDNVITNPTKPDGYGIYVGVTTTGTVIDGNTITGAREAGIASDPASTITNNTISSLGVGSTTGVFLRGGDNGSTVTGNTVTGATVGIDIAPAAGSLANHINRNAITGNTAGVRNRSATLADATCNWWGDASGPSGAGPGGGDSVPANVTFNPWLVGADLAGAACTGGAPTTTTTTVATTTTTTAPSTTSTTTTSVSTTSTTSTPVPTTTTTTSATTTSTSTTATTTLPPITSTTIPLSTPCPTTDPPSGCLSAASGKGSLVLKRKGGAKDRLVWRWRGSGVMPSDFGNPLEATSYVMCLYAPAADGTMLRLVASLPAGGDCGGKPCWKAKRTGFKYKDKELTPDGVSAVNLRVGRTGAVIGVNGKGVDLDVPMLPLGVPIRVQLRRTDANTCWETVFASAKKNTSTSLKARSGP